MAMTETKLAALALSAALLVAAAGAAHEVYAHKGATGIVMKRMMAMKDMGDGMKPLAAMVTGKAAFDPKKVKEIAATLKQHAAEIPKLFPEGSIEGPSEATPAIWKDWDAFVGFAKDLEGLAGRLEGEAGKTKPAALVLFAKIGKTCSECHQDYRKKKE